MRAALLALALCGCATIGHVKVDGWPELKVIEHHVRHVDMVDRCASYAGTEGCALFYLSRGECHIYVSAEFPSARVLEHERLHCAGYDHMGSGNMRRMLKRWEK